MARTKRTSTKNAGEQEDWTERFLEDLAEAGTITGAAQLAGIGRRTVYDRIAREPEFQARIDEVLDDCIQRVESVLLACALNPASTTDRIFYLKTRKPEVYGDKLRQDQIDQIKQEAKRETLAELDRSIQQLPAAVQRLISDAIAGRDNPAITALLEEGTTP